MNKFCKAALFAATLFMMLVLVVRPDMCIASVQNGLRLYSVAVLPSLLPFFFFSKILTSLGAANTLADIGKRPVRFLFNAPPVGAYAMLMSMLSGYPVGSRIVADLAAQGIISKNEAKSLVAFTSTSGPLFVLGTIGTAILGDYKAGVIILVAHYLGAVINGIIFKRRKAPIDKKPQIFVAVDTDNVLSDTVHSSAMSLLAVGIYIVIFNLVADVLLAIGLPDFLANAALALNIPALKTKSVVLSAIEVTRGVMTLAAIGNTRQTTALIAAAVSFGGISIVLQSVTFLSKCGIKSGYFLLTKLSHATVTFFVAALLVGIFY